MNVQIRELTAPQLDQIGRLDTSRCEHAYEVAVSGDGAGLVLKRQETAPAESPSWSDHEITSRLDLWRRNHADKCTFLAAFADTRLVGFLLLAAEPVNGALELYSIFVDRQFRDVGVGSQLIDAAADHCRRSGVKAMYATTTLDGSAVDFYLKAGFRLVGLHDRCHEHPQGEAAFLKRLEHLLHRSVSAGDSR